MIQINKGEGTRVLELGGGFNRNPASDVNIDVREGPGVDFVVDFNNPYWPIQNDEWDCVLAVFVMEHISWRNVPIAMAEIFRIIKPGGRLIVVVPNTENQMRYILSKPEWDGDEGSMLFGDLDYPENSHKSAWSPRWATKLFQEAGFSNILIQPYNPPLNTDMVIEASKPANPETEQNTIPQLIENAVKQEKTSEVKKETGYWLESTPQAIQETPPVAQSVQEHLSNKQEDGGQKPPKAKEEPVEAAGSSASEAIPQAADAPTPGVFVWDPASVFDRQYFDGGKLGGGFAGGGYSDFPVHEITARHILARKPTSVLELGCARGYVLKRLQDAGMLAHGVDVSKHCYLTRVCDSIAMYNLCTVPWSIDDGTKYDLCFSMDFLEHVPEIFLVPVIREMTRTCQRGLHGIDFNKGTDGTKTTVRPKEWWEGVFRTYALGWPVEIVDKNELERGEFPQEVLQGDGKLKLNLGSFTTMFHYGWTNIDQHDLEGYAKSMGYKYLRHDLKNGLPFHTGIVDSIYQHHVLEHLSYKEGLSLLRECRRVLRPTGAMRVLVPDTQLLTTLYVGGGGKFGLMPDLGTLANFDEMNLGCAESPTAAGKLRALLWEGHNACYDAETMELLLKEAGFIPHRGAFRQGIAQVQPILRETLENWYGGISLVYDAVPHLG